MPDRPKLIPAVAVYGMSYSEADFNRQLAEALGVDLAVVEKIGASLEKALPRIEKEQEIEEVVVRFLQDTVNNLSPEEAADMLGPLAPQRHQRSRRCP
jgi:uncharacterized SAM-dependent methyltransferase